MQVSTPEDKYWMTDFEKLIQDIDRIIGDPFRDEPLSLSEQHLLNKYLKKLNKMDVLNVPDRPWRGFGDLSGDFDPY